MTAPLGSTTPFAIPAGGNKVKLTDGAGSPPAGLWLVNRADHNGTVWISAGPTGSAASIPLGPGAVLQWADAATFPYASQSTSSTTDETIVVTSQAAGYSNPATIAAALIQQGIPSTMIDTSYGTWRLFATNSTSVINVGQSASLLVSANWPQPTPQSTGSIRLIWSDPLVPDMPPVVQWLTNDNAYEASSNTWQVPVLAPCVKFTNLANPANADAYVTIVGNNRTVPKLRQIGEEAGSRQLSTTTSSVGLLVPLVHSSYQYTNPPADGFSSQTRFNGPVKVNWYNSSNVNAWLQPMWADIDGLGTISPRYAIAGTDGTIDWYHPSVPVHWYIYYTGPVTNSTFRLVLTGQS